MDRLDLSMRIEIVQLYYKNGHSATAALRKLKMQRCLRQDPFAVSTVQCLIEKFESTGILVDLPRSSRPSVSEDIISGVFTSGSKMWTGYKNPLLYSRALKYQHL